MKWFLSLMSGKIPGEDANAVAEARPSSPFEKPVTPWGGWW